MFGESVDTSLANRAAAVHALREIYEATLIAHIELVGTPDEYSGHVKIDPKAYAYRNAILANKEWGTAFEAWEIVRDETVKNFRNGNLKMYVPVYELL